MSLWTLRLIGALLMATVGTTSAENFRPAGSAAYEDFELDTDSITRQGDLVRFRVRSKSTLPGVKMAYEGQIGVDCVRHTRAEYGAWTRFDHGPAGWHPGSEEMKTVFANTRQAEELATVCAIAHNLPPSQPPLAEVLTTPHPTPEAPQPLSAPATKTTPLPPTSPQHLYASATALLLSPQGHLLVSDVVVGGCARTEAALLGVPPRRVEVLARDIPRGYAIVRLPLAGKHVPIPQSTAGSKADEQVTLFGFQSDGGSFATPAAAAGVVSGRTAAGKDRVLTLPKVRLVSGVVLNQHGAALGLVDGSEAAEAGQRGMGMTRGTALNSLLAAHGIQWGAGVDQANQAPLKQALGRAITGTALVSCYIHR